MGLAVTSTRSLPLTNTNIPMTGTLTDFFLVCRRTADNPETGRE